MSQVALLAGFVSVCLMIGIAMMVYGEIAQSRRVLRNLRRQRRRGW